MGAKFEQTKFEPIKFEQTKFEHSWQIGRECWSRSQSGFPKLPDRPPPLRVYACLPSTNQTLWQLLAEGEAVGTAVIALEQQAGRGQWGRSWQSPLGGLYLSLSLNVDLAADEAAQLTLASAWGVATILRHWQVPVELKWPNDLVIQGKKLGGILTETRLFQQRIQRAIVGIGLNWINPVPDFGINLQTALAGKMSGINSLETLAALTLQGLLLGQQTWQSGNIDSLLIGYLELLGHRHRPMLVNDRWATIVGITPRGALQVQYLHSPNISPNQAVNPSQVDPKQVIDLPPGSIRLGYN